MTNVAQEIFDRVAEGLLGQGGPSMSDRFDETCAYRGVDGRKCAIGHLIPDEKYFPDLEGKCVSDGNVLLTLPLAYQCHLALLELLQDAHDNASDDWGRLPATLDKVAEDLGLKPWRPK